MRLSRQGGKGRGIACQLKGGRDGASELLAGREQGNGETGFGAESSDTEDIYIR